MPRIADPRYDLFRGDCIEVMRRLESNSIDAIVTDPPAGIHFMGKAWDHHKGGRDKWIAWLTEVMEECLRLLKPGGHALVWALPRTSHWTATACENAGFEIRDIVTHCFSTGFPKGLDISKAIDKRLGAERQIVGSHRWAHLNKYRSQASTYAKPTQNVEETVAASDAAKQWEGWNVNLKPAIEHWILCRKPLEGSVAANVLLHGTGGLNIDACRIGIQPNDNIYAKNPHTQGTIGEKGIYGKGKKTLYQQPTGRFPANLILDGSEEVTACFPQSKSGSGVKGNRPEYKSKSLDFQTSRKFRPVGVGGDDGSAARFFASCPLDEEDFEANRLFYCAKASRADREQGLKNFQPQATSRKYQNGEGLAGRTQLEDGTWVNTDKANRNQPRNHHPTVKPVKLMQYLCRLITPPDGLILDCFVGSGSTGKAAMLEGFRFIGIDNCVEYIELARARIEHAIQQGAKR